MGVWYVGPPSKLPTPNPHLNLALLSLVLGWHKFLTALVPSTADLNPVASPKTMLLKHDAIRVYGEKWKPTSVKDKRCPTLPRKDPEIASLWQRLASRLPVPDTTKHIQFYTVALRMGE